MAVSDKKTRIKVTVYKEVAKLVQNDADRFGTSQSEVMAAIVTNHYKETGRLQSPDEKE